MSGNSDPSIMRSFLTHLSCLGLAVLFTAGCQRNLVYLSTPTSAGGLSTTAPERTATIREQSGTVETRTSANGSWTPAVQKQVLTEGSQIRTGSGSLAVIGLTEGSHIYLGAATQLTLSQLNPFLDSQLTTLDLTQGQVWVLLTGGALDVQTPYGIASARTAYLSVEFQPQSHTVNVTCLQGVCGFGSVLIKSGFKLADAANNQSPEQMQLADYGAWGVAVPEATQLAYLATEAIAQGSATIPAVASASATRTQPATATPTGTPLPTATDTLSPNTPSPTPQPPTATLAPSMTPFPSPTSPVMRPTVTPPPFTPLPPAPIIGHHIVQGGDTLFCIARGYGVLPAAIAQANGLPVPFNLRPGQVLAIPEIQWLPISPGPVCTPQFASPFPGLIGTAPTVETTRAPASSPLALTLDWNCIANCGTNQGTYQLHMAASATGGVAPYTFNPAQSFNVDIAHCTEGQGTVTVTSADGQTVQASWTYHDVACH
jgi:LysM repeat protein